MDVTALTWVVAVAGLVLMGILGILQWIAVLRPKSPWTIENVYGGDPSITDPKAYFAFNQGWAWVDAVFWMPIQVVASTGMLLGERWGFLLGLIASVPFWYTAIPVFVWDRDLGVRENTFSYWFVTWGMFPAYGILEGTYAFVRLL